MLKLLLLRLFKEYLEFSQLHFPYILVFFNYAIRQDTQLLIAKLFLQCILSFCL